MVAGGDAIAQRRQRKSSHEALVAGYALLFQRFQGATTASLTVTLLR